MGANNILVKMFMQLAFVGFIVYYFRGGTVCLWCRCTATGG